MSIPKKQHFLTLLVLIIIFVLVFTFIPLLKEVLTEFQEKIFITMLIIFLVGLSYKQGFGDGLKKL